MAENPVPEKASSRKLAAIMFTDIVGYTTMMHHDEQDALTRIEHHRLVLEAKITENSGKILQYYGDGTLSIFTSAYDAITCAVAIQKLLSEDPKVPLRIGIHLGEIVVKGNTIYGDGVNVASRIQSLSVAGGILLSDSIFKQIRNQVEFKFKSLGDYHLKNVDLPIGIYAIGNEGFPIPTREDIDEKSTGSKKISLLKQVPPFARWLIISAFIILMGLSFYFVKDILTGPIIFNPSPKSIAVLPFVNLSADPGQEYFSDGITEDILNHLSKISGLEVKSRTSTLQYKETEKTIPAIGRELDVANILEGSIRKDGNKIRIVAQLIDVKGDVHIWSDTYDREMTEIFNIQSEIAVEIAGVLETKLSNTEISHLRKGQRSTNDITAYDYALRAREIWRNWNDETDLENALQLLEQSINLDPDFAYGYSMIGIVLHFGMREFGVPTQLWIDQALHMAEIAIQIDSTLSEAYLLRSYILKNQKGKEIEAGQDLKKANELDPGNPVVMEALGWDNLISQKRYEEGASQILKSINVGFSKKDREYYERWGWIYEIIGNNRKAEELYLQCKNLAPGWSGSYLLLGKLYQHWGKYEQSIEMLQAGLEIVPDDQDLINEIAWSYLNNDMLDSAAYYWSRYEDLEMSFSDISQYVPFRHRLGYVIHLQGDENGANDLFYEQMQLDLERQKGIRGYGAWSKGGFYYDLGAVNAFLGNKDEAILWLDSASRFGFFDLGTALNDPLLDNIRKDDRFQALVSEKEQEKMMMVNAFKDEMKKQKKNLPL